MPFGFKIGPPVFQRAIEKALRSLLDRGGVSVYIDDIIIFTNTIGDHLRLMREVFECLSKGGFYINLAKVYLFRLELLYLGHIVSSGFLKPDPAKISAIQGAQPPRDKKTLLSFLAAANYLRAYIPRYSELVKPLTDLTRKHLRFYWTDLEQETFAAVKEAILNACYLTMPDWNKPFLIFTDASDVALGAALAQVGENEESLNFISFGSKKLTPTQCNWSPTERELYAIVWACETFSQYIKGSRPLIYSDHKSLCHLTNAESPKVKRWAIRLSEFNPVVTHIGGENNNVADWLSRSVPDDDDTDIPEEMYVPEVCHLVHSGENLFVLPKPEDMIEEAKREEPSLKPGSIDWYNNVAYGRISRRMYIPEKFRKQMLMWFHASRFGGHQGITRTTNRLKKYVWWPNLQKSVVDFINTCPICNSMKPMKATGGEKGALERTKIFELISIDFIGPRKFHMRSYYIMVIVDHYSRFMVAVVTNTTATPAASNILHDHWVAKFGVPKTILCDRDPVFTAQHFKDFVTKECGSKLYYSSTEYPQGNGINESSHRILETAIKTHHWGDGYTVEQMVGTAVLLHNVTPNRNIGDTPASLTFGCDLHLPGLGDFEEEVTEEGRLTKLRNHRGYGLLVKQLQDIDSESLDLPIDLTKPWRQGDVVTYKLSTAEEKRHVHYSNERKFIATRSLPHRVVRVTDKDLILKPLWTKGGERQAPQEQCKRLSTFIPELLRDEAKSLYPTLNWLTPGELAVETTEGPIDKRLGSSKPIARSEEEGEGRASRAKKRKHGGD